jgi:hypothetical protein
MSGESLSPQHGGGTASSYGAANSRQGVLLQLGVGRGANNPSSYEDEIIMKHLAQPRTSTDSLSKRPNLRNVARVT